MFLTITVVIFNYKHCKNKLLPAEDDLIKWLGEYTFSEYFSEPDYAPMVMDYNISIYNKEGMYYADIEIVGQTTWIHVQSTVYGDAEWISLIYYQDLPNNKTSNIEDNTVLISFRNNDVDIYTYWGEIVPMLIGNEESGKAYFSKSS